MAAFSYLALGDSYTIGEAVPIYDSFPYQTVQQLRRQGYDFHAPEIVAKTGWTTGELQAGIQNTRFLSSYDIVSLCIGVNNQYRGNDPDEYREQFEGLLQMAIQFAGLSPQRVFVLSIPDWSVTPFAKNRDTQQIANSIALFNAINNMAAVTYKTHYIDITPGTRFAKDDAALLAADQLHPSGKEYQKWATRLTAGIISMIK